MRKASRRPLTQTRRSGRGTRRLHGESVPNGQGCWCVVCDPTVHNVGGPPGVASPVRIYDCRQAPRSHSTVACSMRGCSTLIRTHRTSSVHRILTNPCCKGDIRHRSNIRGHARRDLAARGLVSGVGGGLVGVEHQGRGASGRALLRGRCGSRLLVRHSRNGHG